MDASRALFLVLATLAMVGLGAMESGCRGASGAQIGEAAGAVAANAALQVAAASMNLTSGGTESYNLDALEEEGPRKGPRALNVERARGVLLATSLASCWPRGVPWMPRDVQVTFSRFGTVARVAVPRPAGLVTFDERCAAEQLRDVIVDPFDGDDVIVGVTYGN